MANPDMAALIARRLSTGLPHPGREDTHEEPRLLPLAAFRTAGMPAEMAQHVADTAQCVGEAVVNLIETEGNSVIIARPELDQLRAAEDQPGDALPVMCMGCKSAIMHLRVVNGRAVVNPDLFRSANLVCPHHMEATP